MSAPAPVLCLMPHQSPICLVHLVFEASCLFFVPFGSVESVERIDKPAVPEHGDAEFHIQFVQINAAHHEKRIIDCREMDKRNFALSKASPDKT
jgi:hypothetical protein